MRQSGRIEETGAAVTITTVPSSSNMGVLNAVFLPALLYFGPSVFPRSLGTQRIQRVVPTESETLLTMKRGILFLYNLFGNAVPGIRLDGKCRLLRLFQNRQHGVGPTLSSPELPLSSGSPWPATGVGGKIVSVHKKFLISNAILCY